MSEQQLVNEIKNNLNARGHFVWRNNSGRVQANYTTKAGIFKNRMWIAGIRGGSDIIGLLKDGRFVAVECKAGKNKPTELQEGFLKEIKDRGGVAIVAYSLADVLRIEGI